jgi:hypothetical protein
VAPAASAALAGARPLALGGCGHFGLLVSPRATDTLLRTLAGAA